MIQVYQTVYGEDSSAYIMARVMRKNSSHAMVAVVAADMSSIIRNVYQTDGSMLVLGPTTLTVADVILSALSTGNIWTVDSTGFNFIDTIPTTAFPTGGATYRVEYKFTLTGGEVFPLVVVGNAMALLAS